MEPRWPHSWSRIPGWEPGSTVPRLVLHYLSTTILRAMLQSFCGPDIAASHQYHGQETGPGNSVQVWNSDQEHLPESLSVLAALLTHQLHRISHGGEFPVRGHKHFSS